MSRAEVERARSAHADRAWEDAYQAFRRADRVAPLAADDLEKFAWAAALTGRDREMIGTNERLYHLRLDAGDEVGAARAAFWVGFRLFGLGEPGRAAGWLGRAERHVQSAAADCVERGYLLIPAVHRHLGGGDPEAAHAAAAEAIAIGERFGDRDLAALARSLQGLARLRQGRFRDGLASLDEAMLAAASGELTPIAAGLVYCTSIDCCHRVYALDRAREWTAALSEWCKAQPQLVTFTGNCQVHRAQVMQLHGDWEHAIEEVRRVSRHLPEGGAVEAARAACYQRGEIHRLRGELDLAEEAYREASRHGLEPQPGLALLRLAQGQSGAAAQSIRRVVGAAGDGLSKARFLPAHVEIMLAIGDVEAARSAAAELEAIASGFESDVLGALAAHARGAVRLAEGDPTGALVPLRSAFDVWQKIGAPYIAARVRLDIGQACRATGDEDGAALELEAARGVFEELGAVPDLGRLQAPDSSRRPEAAGALTLRELQVLRLVAAGKTNKLIARELFVSERTVDRHVSNIFNKLGVSSRAAATAHAYEHKLI